MSHCSSYTSHPRPVSAASSRKLFTLPMATPQPLLACTYLHLLPSLPRPPTHLTSCLTPSLPAPPHPQDAVPVRLGHCAPWCVGLLLRQRGPMDPTATASQATSPHVYQPKVRRGRRRGHRGSIRWRSSGHSWERAILGVQAVQAAEPGVALLEAETYVIGIACLATHPAPPFQHPHPEAQLPMTAARHFCPLHASAAPPAAFLLGMPAPGILPVT